MRYLFIIMCFPITLFAEQTGNLIINGDFENNNSNNWTTSGEVQVLNDCCGSNYDLEFGLQGSIEQDFNLTSDTINQSMLDNGVSLNSSVLIQNGECTGNGCWAGSGRGGADSFTIRLQIKDSDNNILATTTQERYDVTGINGETFENSVTHNGSNANIGNIYIAGTDTAGIVGGLGGANVDDVIVTMTYDPVVLSATQTSHITTTFQEIEEVLFSNVETVEFIPIEEFTFEIYEEPEIILEVFEEIFIEEIKKEEINTGIINLFFEPVETIELTELPPIESFEEIPMESIIEVYETPQTLESFSTEVEVVEEKPKATEVVAVAEEITEKPSTERITEPVGEENKPSSNEESSTIVQTETTTGNEETPREETVAEENNESNEPSGNSVEERAEETELQETETAESESNNETRTASEESSTSDNESEQTTAENNVVDDNTTTDAEVENNSVADISVEKIATKVAEVVKEVDKQLVVTNMIVAKAMQSKINIDTYSSINNNLFNNQTIMNGGSYDEFREYVDNRNIYQQSQVIYNDEFSQYQEKLDEAKANKIRAEEHLRKIRGY